MQNIFKKLLFYDIFIKGDINMNKKTKKIVVWIMVFLMVASFVATIAAYALGSK